MRLSPYISYFTDSIKIFFLYNNISVSNFVFVFLQNSKHNVSFDENQNFSQNNNYVSAYCDNPFRFAIPAEIKRAFLCTLEWNDQ